MILFAMVGLRACEQREAVTPEAMTHQVSLHLQEQQRELDALLEEKGLIGKMFSDQLTATEVQYIARKPFNIYAFEDRNILLFWNSNIVVSNCDTGGSTTGISVYERNGFYLKQCIHLPFLKANQYLVVLFPIVKKYPFNNSYIQSGFEAKDYIPLSTEVHARRVANSHAVMSAYGKPLCYLRYDRADLPNLPPDVLMICCLIAGLLCLFMQVQLIAVWLSRRRLFTGLIPVVAFCVLVLSSLDPVVSLLHFDENHFFSPLYYGSNIFYSSLGHLLLHLLCYLWIILFAGAQIMRMQAGERQPPVTTGWKKGILTLLTTTLIMLACIGAKELSSSIILDSRLNLDIANFYAIDAFAVLSIVMLAMLPLLVLGVIYPLNKLLQSLHVKTLKYICLAVAMVIALMLQQGNDLQTIGVFAWLLLTILLLDMNIAARTRLTSFEKVLIACAYLTLCFTPLARFYLDTKDERNRLAFAQKAVFDLQSKKTADTTSGKSVRESLYPELLQDDRNRDFPGARGYTYAVYRNKALIHQTPDHPFPLYLRNDTLRPGARTAFQRDDYSILRYKTDQATMVSIIDRTNSVIVPLTTVSILLIAMLVVSACIALLYYGILLLLNHETTKLRLQLSFRMRIYLAILSLVLLSFMIIGIATWFIFNNRNAVSNRMRLRTTTHTISRLVQQYVARQSLETNFSNFSSLTDSTDFRDYISDLSANRGVDVNIYDSLGTLMATSQDNIYRSYLLAAIMNPDAYYTLAEEEKAVDIQEENISKLRYLSCYVPLRNEEGKAYGYLNVPYLASGLELSFQISNVLVALIDVYVFMLILSIGAAFFISNRLTKGLKVITDHFERYSATDNVAIDWHDNDEIGLMIEKYNANLAKVQEAVEKLARGERESAWREMARQVAHEIKNPLTPMKLSIQYLQMTLRKGGDNVPMLTERTAATLLEQIDNLSHIATAFSDFARMPEAAPEPIAINTLLQKAVELHTNNPMVAVTLQAPQKPLVVFTDHSQILRVMNNLLQNAVDAITDERGGTVVVSLQQQGDDAVISVTDTGEGIAPDVVPRIFSPYFTTKGSGTGLGLAMTQKIIEFWKGSISFDTEVGKGTTFTVRLPLLHG
jgi:nitrogen fixation/metabolism regulation signal transduction histidine kinase